MCCDLKPRCTTATTRKVSRDIDEDVQLALTASGCASARVVHKQRLLSDNGSSYVSGDLQIGSKIPAWRTCAVRPIIRRPRARSSAGIRRLRTASCSKTTTYPAISKRTSIASSITTITQRYHESLRNLTPADVCIGRGQTILLQRERIKRETIKLRRLQHQRKAA
jgi:putative transposase